MNVLVTGGTGFLGLYIVERLLARGESVRILARHSIREVERPEIDFFQGDVRNRQDVLAACREIDVVIHTAALTGIDPCYRPFYQTNVIGTKNVLAGCRKEGVRRLIFTSSPSVIDEGKPLEGVDETSPYPKRQLSYYAKTKGLAERLVLEADGSPLESPHEGVLRTCAIRPRLIWGPRDRQLIPRLVEKARKRGLVRIGDGKNRLDMTYVENAADAHLLVMDALASEKPVAGKAYFISQGEPINCWEWIDRILVMVGFPPVQKRISYRTAYWIGFAYEMIYRLFRIRGEPPLTRFLTTQLAQSYWFDLSAARRDFGYSPNVSTEEGIRRLAVDLKKRYGKD